MGFGPADLEEGNPDKGLSGTGAGSGDWRLAFESDLSLRVLALARPPGGGLAPVHDTAPGSARGGYEVVFFNPASNRGLASRLRLANRSGSPAAVTIAGTDAAGQAGESAVTLNLPARAACTLSAPVLESGAWGDTGPGAGCGTLAGALGDGAGKWRLMVTSDQPLAVMSLLASAAGHLTNLSSVPARAEAGEHRLALLLPADDPSSQGFVRLVNRDTRAGTVRIRAFDDTGEEYPTQTLTLGAGFGVGFSARDLEEGHEALGLTGTGSGAGRWRLVLEPAPADLDLQALSYVRNPGSSSLAALHDTAPGSLGSRAGRSPSSTPRATGDSPSRLRLVNRGDAPAAVTIAGTDADGQAGESPVTLRIPARAACTLSAPVLESGAWGDTGPAAGCEDARRRARRRRGQVALGGHRRPAAGGDGPAATHRLRQPRQPVHRARVRPLRIPVEADHPFQSKAITDSTPMPITVGVGTARDAGGAREERRKARPRGPPFSARPGARWTGW